MNASATAAAPERPAQRGHARPGPREAGSGLTLLLLGAPGTGKSTLVQNLIPRYPRLRNFGVRRRVKHAGKVGTPAGLACLRTMEAAGRGKLLPVHVVRELFAEFMGEVAPEHGPLVVEGFPIDAEQARVLEEVLAAHGRAVDLVVVLDAPTEELHRRIALRLTCNACVDAGGLEPNVAPDARSCPRCGAPLERRREDERARAAERIAAFRSHIAEVTAAFPEVPRVTVDTGSGSPGQVHAQVQAVLDEHTRMHERLGAVRAVVFDVDDTLVETYATGFRKMREVARRLAGTELDEAAFRRGYGHLPFEECLALWVPGVPAEVASREYDRTGKHFPDRPIADLGLAAARLRTLGVEVGIVTNGPAAKTERKLLAAGAPPLAAGCVVDAGSGLPPKPAPDMLRRVAERMGLRPHELLYVGDAPGDHQCATAAGVPFAAVQTGPFAWHEVPADRRPFTLPSARGVAPLLESSRARATPRVPLR